MDKIDWKSKLTSRRFWAAIIGFATAIMIAFGMSDMTIQQIIAIISGSATLIAYIIGEGLVDAAKIPGGDVIINWKSKLTSRKFWAAVVGFVTPILVAIGAPDMTIEQVVALISGVSTVIAYIVGEGLVDAARLNSQIVVIEETTTTEEDDTDGYGT